MDMGIVSFSRIKVAVIEHIGSPALEPVKKLTAWRLENKLPPSDVHRSYGVHYNDLRKVLPSEYRVDLCLSVKNEVSDNSYGVVTKNIPALRCAKARHFGSREKITAAQYL